MKMRRVVVSARMIMFLSQACKSDLRSDTDIERKGELFLYYFPMHLRKNDLNICCGILRTQKPKTQCKPHRQMGRKQCLPKREEAGITLSSFLTLKSSNVITGKILKDQLVPRSHFTHETSKTQERLDDLQHHAPVDKHGRGPRSSNLQSDAFQPNHPVISSVSL